MAKQGVFQYLPVESKTVEIEQALLQRLSAGNLVVGCVAEELQEDEWCLLERLASLRDRGMPITALAEGEYALEQDVQLLNSALLAADMQTEARKIPLHVAWSLASTNQTAAAMANKAEGPFFLLAEQQTEGRGRRGKKWVSPFGSNLYLSYKTDFSEGAAQLAGLSLVVGVAVAAALKKLSRAEGISIKWPNDVYFHERKLGGILIEVVGDMQGSCSAIIGLGLNGSLPKGDVGQPVAAVEELLGAQVMRNQWVAHILDAIYTHVERFKVDGLQAFLADWRRYHLLEGQFVNVLLGEQTIEGRVVGVAPTGELLVETKDGIEAFSAGEVSVRKHVAAD